MSAAHLHVRLLGPFRLHLGDQPVAGFDQARLQHLLAYLVLHRATPISRRQLAFALWPDTSDHQAFKNLRTLLTRLRQALPEADYFVSVTTQMLQWRPDAPFTLDVAEFESAIAQAAADARREDGDHARTASALAAAVAAYAGDLLPDCYDDWVLPRRERLRLACADALERLVLLLEEERDYSRALPYAQRLLNDDPLHEAAYRHLMRLHLALGERAEALRVYHLCDTMLQREFGIGPARPTQDIYARLLRTEGQPATAVRPAEARPGALPLIGRKSEWSLLVSAWRAAAAGAPQMILLTGEAGIGKTRLAEELRAWVARQGAATAAAHCYALGEGGGALAYAPVAEWLGDASLRPRLTALDDVWLVEVARILPGLLAERPRLAAPGPLTEAWQRTRLFEALARAVLGAAQGGRDPRRGGARDAFRYRASPGAPLLLFLDDLQWADRETLDWLGYLMHFDSAAPLLIVSTVRWHEVAEDHPLITLRLELARSGLLNEIHLSPLDAVETASLAAGVAGRDMRAGEAAQIFKDSEGNPLFVVEMVRASMGDAETGAPKEDDLVSSASPALPPKVRAVIQWRLAMLSPVAQTLAQTAAVIGRKFGSDVLASTSGQDEAAVAEGLDELWRRQLVRALDDGAYDFSHDAIRAVAYDGSSPIRRRAMHLRVAEALEALHRDDLDAFSGQIAHHYEQAGRPQPAIMFYRRAAAAAQRVYANAEATRLYRHLLESDLSTSLSAHEKCAMMLALGEVWRMNGHWAWAEALDRDAIATAEATGDTGLQAQAQAALGAVMHLLGYYDEALEWLAKAEIGFKAIGDGRGMVGTLWTMGQIYWFRGDHQRALAALERQLQIATEIGDERGIGEALETLGMVYWSQGRWEQSADCCLKAIAIAEPLDHKLIITRAAITLGNVRAAQHGAAEAVQWYLRAGVLARQIDDRQILSWAISNIALVLAKRGDYMRAISGYERSLRNAWEISDRWTACLNVAGLATVNERLGRVDLAEALYRKAIGFGSHLGNPSYLSGMLVGLARLLLARGRAAEARDFYGEALAKISSVAGERLAGEDTRFDARVLGIRLHHAFGEAAEAQAIAEIQALLLQEAALHRQAALRYELWRLAPADVAARIAAAEFYRSQHAETGAEECRSRYRELTGETLPNPPPLPDISELIPDKPEGLDLAPLLAELETSFDLTP